MLDDPTEIKTMPIQPDDNLYSLNRTMTTPATNDDDNEDLYMKKDAIFKSLDNYNDDEGEHSDDSDDVNSVLSEIDNESTYFENKIQFQRRALFRKNATLQWRQKWTNIVQIMAPVIGLLIVLLVKMLGGQIMDGLVTKLIYVPFPFIYGLDYNTLSSVGGFFNVTECD